MLNLSVLLEDSARRYPAREALVLGSTRLTYAQVDASANQVANPLVSRGISPGDKVALSCPNVQWFPIVYYGILKAGAVVVPFNVLLKSHEIAYHLRDADVAAYLCFEGSPELPMGAEGHAAFLEVDAVEQFFLITAETAAPGPIEGAETLDAALADLPTAFDSVPRQATDTAVILYTSGTTGQAKGAELSHANTMMNVHAVNRLFMSPPATDSHVLCLPLFHTFGATVQMHAGFSGAATLHLVPRFDAEEVVQLMDSEELRVGISGGAALPVEISNQVKQRLGVTVLEGYGLSETSPVATFSDPDREPRAGSIGVPIWGVELTLVDPEWNELTGPDVVGEIAIKGHNVMKGYYNRPEATAEVIREGWFRTGNLAPRDEDGFYYIVDRSKDIVIRGGFNIYPREIEETLLAHPAISLAAVIGVPHESHGEEVKAFVVLTPGASVDADDIVGWCEEQVASYKYPRIAEIVDTLPMTATGKVLKRELA